MTDLENTELQLISGYPNIRFGSVDSPPLARHLPLSIFPTAPASRRQGFKKILCRSFIGKQGVPQRSFHWSLGMDEGLQTGGYLQMVMLRRKAEE